MSEIVEPNGITISSDETHKITNPQELSKISTESGSNQPRIITQEALGSSFKIQVDSNNSEKQIRLIQPDQIKTVSQIQVDSNDSEQKIRLIQSDQIKTTLPKIKVLRNVLVKTNQFEFKNVDTGIKIIGDEGHYYTKPLDPFLKTGIKNICIFSNDLFEKWLLNFQDPFFLDTSHFLVRYCENSTYVYDIFEISGHNITFKTSDTA